MGRAIAAVAWAAAGIALAASAKIEHVVVLMEENRSFDHMMGFYNRVDPRVNGLTGFECQWRNVSDHSKGKVCVNQHGYDVGPDDPCHGHACTTEQIYGNDKCENPEQCGEPHMDGFVQNALGIKHNESNVVSMFNATTVPVISTLAQEFALFDHFFCSHPGPTYPNRQFVHSATAHGEQDDEVPKEGFPQEMIYDRFNASNLPWKVYYEDSLAWIIFLARLRDEDHKPFIRTMDEFYKDAAAGTLPTYSFIEPRISVNHSYPGPSRGLSNHQHPDASVREGERLFKDMYEALRAGPAWNKTLFIITYDEHGGFYDHVHPPQVGVPNPDGINTTHGFNYTRLGIRIPTLMISPWIKKGTLVSAPPESQKPQPTSQWELSSIPATMIKMFNLTGGFLTKRDAWAATFEYLLEELDEPRTDCPMKMPDVPPPSDEMVEREINLPLNDHHKGLLNMLADVNGVPREGYGAHIQRQGDFSAFSKREFERWLHGH